MQRPPRVRSLALALGAAALLLIGGAPAQGKMKHKEWKSAESLFLELFSQPGNPKGKAQILETIAADASPRAWRLMADGLTKEVQLWIEGRQEVDHKSARQAELLKEGTDGYTPAEEEELKALQPALKELEAQVRAERGALEGVVAVLVKGPEVLRKSILQRATSGGTWAYRAAAARVAAATLKEQGSWDWLRKAVSKDPDPRVRTAALDALSEAKEKWEDLVIGRLADPNWGVVLFATRIVRERHLKKAVPHLINALPSASPRVAEAIALALKEITQEDFGPFADIWGKWWRDHGREFNKDATVHGARQKEFAQVHFYGVPIESDRVLFIIDISDSMKLITKNDNPRAHWKAPPPITGGKAPPPPPPPEEILSGPKIDVAKHELKQALKKFPKEWSFNIIAFNTGARAWDKSMVKATEKNKERAYKWIRALQPSGSTYIDGALRMGFRLAGLLNFDKRYPDIQVDTIVLLSDGAPTTSDFPVSKLMEPKVILEHVREWNRDKHVVINCIGVDMVTTVQFLKELATENGGIYVDR